MKTPVVGLILALGAAAPAWAQQPLFPPAGTAPAASPMSDERVNQIIDELRRIINDGERRRGDRQTLDSLRQVVQRYDWPWRVRVLNEEFRDGNMSRDPAWNVAGGSFQVDAQLGMRTVQNVRRTATQQQQQQQQQPAQTGGLGARVLGAVLDEVARQNVPPGQQQAAPVAGDRGEAFVQVPFANAFAVTVQLNSRSRDGGRIEIGPYQGADRRAGYRLAYNPGQTPSLEILRVTPTGTGVVQTSQGALALDDGANHRIQWTRDREGMMRVSVDGQQVMEAQDRGLSGEFGGFSVVNLGGDFGLRSILVEATERR